MSILKKSTQRQNISINKQNNEKFKAFYPGLATKELILICQNSQCISQTLFSFKTANSFKFENTHKEGKKTRQLYKQNVLTFLILLTLSSYYNARSRKAYFESKIAKILCATSLVSYPGGRGSRTGAFSCLGGNKASDMPDTASLWSSINLPLSRLQSQQENGPRLLA